MTPDSCRVAARASVTVPRIMLPGGMTVYSSTPTLSSTRVSKVWPTLADADCKGDVVRTMMTLPAGSMTRDCADTAEAAMTASAAAPKAGRQRLSIL